jgi:ABC-type antimicrobial peptide transport system permease subunit
MRSKLGITLLIIGGILMIVSSAIGSIGVYEFLRDYVNGQITIQWIKDVLDVCVEILRWIANFGGVTVIVGALFIAFNHYRFGKWLISIGLTFGTLALIIWLISFIVDNTNLITDPQILLYLDNLKGMFTYNTGLQFFGVVVAVIGKNFAKRPKKAKKEEEEISEETRNVESETPIPFQNIFCPECGASLPFNAEFCSECGHTIDKT